MAPVVKLPSFRCIVSALGFLCLLPAIVTLTVSCARVGPAASIGPAGDEATLDPAEQPGAPEPDSPQSPGTPGSPQKTPGSPQTPGGADPPMGPQTPAAPGDTPQPPENPGDDREMPDPPPAAVRVGIGRTGPGTGTSISEGDTFRVQVEALDEVVEPFWIRVRIQETAGGHGTVIENATNLVDTWDPALYPVVEVRMTYRVRRFVLYIRTENDDTDDIPDGHEHWISAAILPDLADPPRYRVVSGSAGVQVTETE